MLKFNQYLEEKFGDICPQCMQDPCVCGGNHIAEENQLDEITTKALQSYRQKAHTQIQHYKYGSGKDKPEASKVLAKREPGMAKATDKVIKKDKERIAAQPKPTPQKSEPYKPLGGRDEKSGRSYSEETEQIDELSNDKLDQYKKAAGEDASKQDKAGNFEKGHKRFKGIMKATFKQFANDAKK
jgi:hypothetical protein